MCVCTTGNCCPEALRLAGMTTETAAEIRNRVAMLVENPQGPRERELSNEYVHDMRETARSVLSREAAAAMARKEFSYQGASFVHIAAHVYKVRWVSDTMARTHIKGCVAGQDSYRLA